MIKQLQQEYLQVTYCMCDLLVGFDMHGFECSCMFLLLSVAWIFQVMTMVFSLSLHFPNSMVCWDVYLRFDLWNFLMDFGI